MTLVAGTSAQKAVIVSKNGNMFIEIKAFSLSILKKKKKLKVILIFSHLVSHVRDVTYMALLQFIF